MAERAAAHGGKAVSVTVKLGEHTSLSYCPDCDSKHLGSRCGMNYLQRLRSCRISSEWMPAKNRDRQIGKAHGGKDYYDDEGVKQMFGQSGKDNYEELMEDTQGVGVVAPDELAKYPELVHAHYLDNERG